MIRRNARTRGFPLPTGARNRVGTWCVQMSALGQMNLRTHTGTGHLVSAWLVSWREIFIVPHSAGSESIIMIIALACASYARRSSVFGSEVHGCCRRAVESRYCGACTYSKTADRIAKTRSARHVVSHNRDHSFPSYSLQPPSFLSHPMSPYIVHLTPPDTRYDPHYREILVS